MEATLVVDQGAAGSVDRSRRRQVTLLESEAWQASVAELGVERDPSLRRANLLLSGIKLAHTRGRVLAIGDARLAIGGELTPCERMDEAARGLQKALRPDWRGGVFTRVLTGGVIHVGDLVEWASVRAEQIVTPSFTTHHCLWFSDIDEAAAFVAALSRYLASPSGSHVRDSAAPVEIWAAPAMGSPRVRLHLSSGALRATEAGFGLPDHVERCSHGDLPPQCIRVLGDDDREVYGKDAIVRRMMDAKACHRS